MRAVVVVDDGCGLAVETRRLNQPNKNKLLLYTVQLMSKFTNKHV